MLEFDPYFQAVSLFDVHDGIYLPTYNQNFLHVMLTLGASCNIEYFRRFNGLPIKVKDKIPYVGHRVSANSVNPELSEVIFTDSITSYVWDKIPMEWITHRVIGAYVDLCTFSHGRYLADGYYYAVGPEFPPNRDNIQTNTMIPYRMHNLALTVPLANQVAAYTIIKSVFDDADMIGMDMVVTTPHGVEIKFMILRDGFCAPGLFDFGFSYNQEIVEKQDDPAKLTLLN